MNDVLLTTKKPVMLDDPLCLPCEDYKHCLEHYPDKFCKPYLRKKKQRERAAAGKKAGLWQRLVEWFTVGNEPEPPVTTTQGGQDTAPLTRRERKEKERELKRKANIESLTTELFERCTYQEVMSIAYKMAEDILSDANMLGALNAERKDELALQRGILAAHAEGLLTMMEEAAAVQKLK